MLETTCETAWPASRVQRRGRRGPALAGTAPNGMPRILAFVMDSAGVGALPDAVAYHDALNANTIGNVAERLGGLRLPNFERLGLGHITRVRSEERRVGKECRCWWARDE